MTEEATVADAAAPSSSEVQVASTEDAQGEVQQNPQAEAQESIQDNAPEGVPDEERIEASVGRVGDEDLEFMEGWDANSSATTSVTSSIYRHSFENGRRFAAYESKYGGYPIPNDDIEQNREDIKHAMMLELTGGKLFYAPLKNPQKIIDIGTGTGIWAIDGLSLSLSLIFAIA
jgi:hypothetical protein